MSEASRFLEEERQLILLALGHLAMRRPGWEPALRGIAAKLDGEDLFTAFKQSGLESLRLAAPLPPFSQGKEEG